MAREVLMLVKESTFGTPVASPVLGVDKFYIKLSQDDAFSMEENPIITSIQHGGGVTTTSCRFSGQKNCAGSLQGELYPEQALTLLKWATTPIDSEREEPWVTASSGSSMFPIGDLSSVSLYHAYYVDSNNSWVRKRYSGVKCLSGSVSGSDSAAPITYNFSLQGITNTKNAAGTTADPDATEFPLPDDTDYPCVPYLYVDLGGNLKIATTRSEYSSVTFNWTNSIEAKWYENRYARFLRYGGRGDGTTLAVNLLKKHSPDDEAAFQALTTQDAEILLDNGSGYTLKIDLNTNNIWTARTNSRPNGGAYLWNGTLSNGFDATTGTDFVITGTVPEVE